MPPVSNRHNHHLVTRKAQEATQAARGSDDVLRRPERKDSESACTECVRRVRLVPFGSFEVAAAAAWFGLGRFLRFPSGQVMIVAV